MENRRCKRGVLEAAYYSVICGGDCLLSFVQKGVDSSHVYI